jgi:hypothetical protein
MDNLLQVTLPPCLSAQCCYDISLARLGMGEGERTKTGAGSRASIVCQEVPGNLLCVTCGQLVARHNQSHCGKSRVLRRVRNRTHSSLAKDQLLHAGGPRFEPQTGRVVGKSIPSLWRDEHPAIKGLRPPEHRAGRFHPDHRDVSGEVLGTPNQRIKLHWVA